MYRLKSFFGTKTTDKRKTVERISILADAILIYHRKSELSIIAYGADDEISSLDHVLGMGSPESQRIEQPPPVESGS